MKDHYFSGVTSSSDSLNFRKFNKEIEEMINSNDEIISRSKECNKNFLVELNKLIESTKPENIGSAVLALIYRTPRYSYIKNLEFNGKEYEAEIDELKRVFCLHEV